MSRARRDRVGEAADTSAPVVMLLILFFLSPIILLIELYLQNKILKIKWRIKDIVWALNSTYSFWVLVIGVVAICIFKIFDRYEPIIYDYIPLIVVILLLAPHFYFSFKYKSKFNRFARLKAKKRRMELREKADIIIKKEKEEDRLRREINKTAR
ncbi:hypothetical protein [Campylobacter concisus]|uniref:hypothetical protein n=1 Tax=Campylobacter concisus TaxID=199 RepID=UPI000CD83878|nr:hypothetical protein [Campylobacter concisus]